MKKFLSLFVACVLCLCALAGCGSEKREAAAGTGSGDRLQIVTTIFPEYDWVMNILGDKAADADVTMLLNNGVDLHSFQPTAEDILKISTCDMFVYVGGESNEWVEDALEEAVNKDMVVINLMDVLGDSVKEEEVVEGMDHDHEHEEGEVEYDEHVWLSLKNTITLVESISSAMQKLDPDDAGAYKTNTEAYVGKLSALDEKYAAAVQSGSVKTVLFGDRFPFRYLTDDYGLKYYAAFAGCTAETEASFETITFLSKKIDELKLPAVLTIEGDEHKIAETIVQNTRTKDQKILTMDSMQATTSDDVKNGTTYLSVMESNLSVLKEALCLG